MYSTKGLKLINGVVVANTKKFGWRSIIGFRVQILRYEKNKPRFYQGRIAAIDNDKVQIKIPSYVPGVDDKSIIVGFKDPWEIIGPPIEKIELPILKPINPIIGPRCDIVRPGIHPKTHQILTLQCVLRLGHPAAHHYENPSNKERK